MGSATADTQPEILPPQATRLSRSRKREGKQSRQLRARMAIVSTTDRATLYNLDQRPVLGQTLAIAEPEGDATTGSNPLMQ